MVTTNCQERQVTSYYQSAPRMLLSFSSRKFRRNCLKLAHHTMNLTRMDSRLIQLEVLISDIVLAENMNWEEVVCQRENFQNKLTSCFHLEILRFLIEKFTYQVTSFPSFNLSKIGFEEALPSK